MSAFTLHFLVGTCPEASGKSPSSISGGKVSLIEPRGQSEGTKIGCWQAWEWVLVLLLTSHVTLGQPLLVKWKRWIRSEVGKLWPTGPIWPTARACKYDAVGTRPYSFVKHILYGLPSCNSRVESLQRRSSGPHSWKYWLWFFTGKVSQPLDWLIFFFF